jgi:hypothetical protein
VRGEIPCRQGPYLDVSLLFPARVYGVYPACVRRDTGVSPVWIRESPLFIGLRRGFRWVSGADGMGPAKGPSQWSVCAGPMRLDSYSEVFCRAGSIRIRSSVGGSMVRVAGMLRGVRLHSRTKSLRQGYRTAQGGGPAAGSRWVIQFEAPGWPSGTVSHSTSGARLGLLMCLPGPVIWANLRPIWKRTHRRRLTRRLPSRHCRRLLRHPRRLPHRRCPLRR